jgi:hypothetical protein
MNKQISFCLSDEVAPYFNSEIITHYCKLIDEKKSKGLAYGDLKEQLLEWITGLYDLDIPFDSYNVYRKAYEFAKYY